jgi:hypothetical protein
MNRRELLQAVMGTLLYEAFPAHGGREAVASFGATSEAPEESLIAQENRRPGTTDWQLTRVRINRGKYRTSLIEGYCSHQSVEAGQTLWIMVSTDPPRRFVLDIYRMGWYGGAGGRHLVRLGPFQGRTQPVPERGPDPGRLRECRWEPTVEWKIPRDWISGVYLGKLTTLPESRSEPYWQSYVIFIVRDRRRADILFQCSDNTWQAYNQWPESDSLYTHPAGAHAAGVSVSFDRPYGMYVQILENPLSVGSGEFLLWEFPVCYWLEQHGYDVTYGSNSDCIDPDFVLRCKVFLSVGHDEYWDLRQYRAIEKAIEEGVHVLWLSANCVYMVSPFSPNGAGQPLRRLTREGCYGELRAEELKAYGSLFAGIRSAGPDERRLIGARTVVPFNGGGDWTCVKPSHWVFEGTDMRAGDSIPGLVGWEYHGDPDLEREGLEVLAEGPVWAGGDVEGRYTATLFPGPRGNFVFNAATIFWGQGLASPPGHLLPWSHWSRPHGPDRRVQRITENLLQRALGRGRP